MAFRRRGSGGLPTVVGVVVTVLALSPSTVLPQARAEQALQIPVIRQFLADGGFGEPHPTAPEELGQFGRLAGIWEAIQEMRTQDGSWVVAGPALWTWRYTLGGFAVQDLWYQAEDELPAYLANLQHDYLLTALRTFDVRSQRWKIAWTANGMGQAFGDDFGTMEAVWNGTELVLTSPPNDYGIQRVRFTDVRPDSFSWISEFSQDAGETWRAVMRVSATRLR